MPADSGPNKAGDGPKLGVSSNKGPQKTGIACARIPEERPGSRSFVGNRPHKAYLPSN